ncbi:MAG TPA: CCA tRNA nucleotidyltransferase [Acidimicrobiaceae bacterium]|nr:CCA tRNA nucleotidyltransferase [Acidimicrobiaceae bacterium]|tara:strand:+ start:12563 stop:13810 length:1248 start_codon:yes stop_codon:yes gene_type:complete
MSDSFDGQRRVVAPLADRFDRAGHRLYLVGGVVRDGLMGRQVDTPDLDLTTDATPAQTRVLVDGIVDAVWLQGERFGTIGVRLAGHTIEITTHRAEVYTSDSRKPGVSYSTDLVEDLSRRDFTVNAMAVDVVDGVLHDPHGGRLDLDAGLLRTPLDPEISFTDDPLRMMRAARFIAGYGFTPAPGLLDAVTSLADRMEIVSAERKCVELFRLLSLPDPGPGLVVLVEAGLVRYVFPKVAGLGRRVLSGVFDQMVRAPAEPLLRLVVFSPVVGVAGLQEMAVGLRMSGRDTADLMSLAQTINDVVSADDTRWSDEKVRRLASRAGNMLDSAMRLVTSLGLDDGALTVAVDRLSDAGELDDLGPALDGAAVMDLLCLSPGIEVGEALAWLGELRLSEGRLGPDESAKRLSAWWNERF